MGPFLASSGRLKVDATRLKVDQFSRSTDVRTTMPALAVFHEKIKAKEVVLVPGTA